MSKLQDDLYEGHRTDLYEINSGAVAWRCSGRGHTCPSLTDLRLPKAIRHMMESTSVNQMVAMSVERKPMIGKGRAQALRERSLNHIASYKYEVPGIRNRNIQPSETLHPFRRPQSHNDAVKSRPHAGKPPSSNNPHSFSDRPHLPNEKPHPFSDRPHLPNEKPHPFSDRPHLPNEKPRPLNEKVCPPDENPHPWNEKPYPPNEKLHPPNEKLHQLNKKIHPSNVELPSSATKPPSPALKSPASAMRPPSRAMTPPSPAMTPPFSAIRPPSPAMRPPSPGMRPPSPAMMPSFPTMRPPHPVMMQPCSVMMPHYPVVMPQYRVMNLGPSPDIISNVRACAPPPPPPPPPPRRPAECVLVMENLPLTCHLPTLIEFVQSYGRVITGRIVPLGNPSSVMAEIDFVSADECQWAASCLADGEALFPGHRLNVYQKKY